MNDMHSVISELTAAIHELGFPSGLTEKYDLLECLSQGHGTETYLVRQKGTGVLCITKAFDKAIYAAADEGNILQSLNHAGLPAFMDEFENEAAYYIVREYVDGTPLDKYAASRDLTEAQAVALCVKLCDILVYLHGLEPPVIHRDVKPQNVIVRENGDVYLIDFDIARTYDADAQTDTRFIGTRTYAPPEQYGFTQTDRRADIYALGILLCFLLTGDTEIKNAKITNRRLDRIVHRCVAFSPEERFANANAVKKALLAADGRGRKRFMRGLVAGFAALILVCSGFALGRFTDLLAKPVVSSGVQFSEPLIEKAVRIQLNKSDLEPIGDTELAAVREIYIFGNEVARTEEPFSDGLGGELRDLPRGAITSLEDVTLLPNLEVLYVNYQTLEDISPVSSLRHLTTVSLRNTFVDDISALANMERLNRVSLFDTRVSDYSALGSCPVLYSLDIGRTPVVRLDELPDLAVLRELSLRQTTLTSLAGIERFEGLESLDLCRTSIRDMTPLDALSNLLVVHADEIMEEYFEAHNDVRYKVIFN